jgi:hypothetical protein
MPNSHRLVVISPDGQISRYDEALSVTGEDAPSIRDISGARYALYRCTLFGISGRVYGFIAALEPPTNEARDRAAAALFGPQAFGLVRLEPVGGLPDAAS